MKALLRFIACLFMLFFSLSLFAQDDLYAGQTFIDKAIWFVVPALALVVIVLMIRNRKQIAGKREEEE